jgi:hypothetical protein
MTDMILGFTEISGGNKRAQKRKLARAIDGATRPTRRDARRAKVGLPPIGATSQYRLPDVWKPRSIRTPADQKPSPVTVTTGPCTFQEHNLATCGTCAPKRPYATPDKDGQSAERQRSSWDRRVLQEPFGYTAGPSTRTLPPRPLRPSRLSIKTGRMLTTKEKREQARTRPYWTV